MIPEAKKSAVARALQETFGVDEYESIQLSASAFTSAHVYRIQVKDRPYLLRVVTRTDAPADPTRQFACMKTAADRGLAPPIRYTSVEDRISIIDFIEAKPLPVANATVFVASALQATHGLPPFAKLTNEFDTSPTFLLRTSSLRDGFVQKFQAAKILPDDESAELFKLYDRVRSIYPWPNLDLVSSHNDLKPANLLFDGQRLWLIDWEAAFLNDRYSDLAVMANFVVATEDDEEVYLRAYFGIEFDEYKRERFYLMRQIVHAFYALVFTNLGSGGKPIDPTTPVPEFRGFHNRIWAGQTTLDVPETKLQFGLVHLHQLLRNARTSRFQDALRIVAKSHATV